MNPPRPYQAPVLPLGAFSPAVTLPKGHKSKCKGTPCECKPVAKEVSNA